MDSGGSPDGSDEESGSVSPVDEVSPGNSPKSQGHIKDDPDDDVDDTEKPKGDGPSMPVQKRRRVTRACDECRRKKIKCDGKQPCTHCSVYSYGKKA
jgi:hypothetical protein